MFDIIFMLQHYVLYVDNEEEEETPSPETEPLLSAEERFETQADNVAVIRMV